MVMIVMFAVTTVPCCRQDQHSAVFIWFAGTPIGKKWKLHCTAVLHVAENENIQAIKSA